MAAADFYMLAPGIGLGLGLGLLYDGARLQSPNPTPNPHPNTRTLTLTPALTLTPNQALGACERLEAVVALLRMMRAEGLSHRAARTLI